MSATQDFTFSGVIGQIENGRAHFRLNDGTTGVVTLRVNAQVKKTLEWLRDDGSGTTEYEVAR